MEQFNQVIVNETGNSWFKVFTTNAEFNKKLNEILLSKNTKNRYWLLNLQGDLIAANESKHEVLKYYNNNSVIVHKEIFFI